MTLSRILLAGLFASVAAVGLQAARVGDSATISVDGVRIARLHFGADAPWYVGNIPFFEAADPILERVYYYRWGIVRAHQRDLGQLGYVTTEFLRDVPWQRQPFATMNDSAAFHIAEERWLRDRRYASDEITYLYEHGGNDRHFSESIADAAYGRFLVDGDLVDIRRHIASMRRVYQAWNDHFDVGRGLYWITPIDDATEYSVASIDASGGSDGFRGGAAFRPSINSMMFANARAISALASLTGDHATARLFAAKANSLRSRVEADLWHPSLMHFTDRFAADTPFVRRWAQTRARELVGFVPWTFGLPTTQPRYAAAWRSLLSADEFGGEAGLRTVEPAYPFYMRQYRYDIVTGRPECQWNGPVWPFQTTQVLIAMANLLNGPANYGITRSDYLALLTQYARLHFTSDDRLDLQEDYDPKTGLAIVGMDRSHHYDHSGFNDLIITGLVGLRPRADDVIELNPLSPVDRSDPHYLRYFALQDIPYHGHLLSVLFDADGSRYGRGAGLFLFIDGQLAARRSNLGQLKGLIGAKPLLQIRRLIDLSVQLDRKGYPRAWSSTRSDPESLHEAIDGRIWFYPEVANGWSSPASSGGPIWLAIDLGRRQKIGSAELAFYSEGTVFAPPLRFRIEAWIHNRWLTVHMRHSTPVLANGITRIAWRGVTARRARIVLKPRPGYRVRIVEFKLFGEPSASPKPNESGRATI